ncbi:hypothetical protein Slin15195_G108040 [Septoria linicola]|uniref:Uncharacterized protein n=1 Tax=Septoria linicola TaxID=215465 RepID=A0A9Q9AYJ7_9PEZI|nr:hypothetical protein Slin14017_G106340 [Septoria linicola]USW57485.1 hypothetical protein Slin15195_G108040 [Septoria linicola]
MSRNFQPWAILPVLVIATAFILSFLCVFAGNKPGYMEGYHVFTVNATRFGQNAVEKIDQKVMGLNLSKILTKRDLPAEPVSVSATATVTITTVPAAYITLAPRNPDGLDDFVDDISDGIASVKSDAGDAIGGAITSVKDGIESKATAVASAVESKASSIEGVVASKISSAIASAQTAIVEQVNETYTDVLSSLDLQGFYSIHMLTTCSGDYKTPNGVNITVGGSPLPPNGTHKIVETCSKHSSLNPLSLIRVLFETGIFFTGLCLLTSLWATICFSRKISIINIVVSLPALGFLSLASAATHGIATAAPAVLNFLGEEVGLKAHAGQSFITLVWATTILVLVNACLWTILCFTAEHLPDLSTLRRLNRNNDDGYTMPAHELKIVHPGEPAYERGPTGHSDVAAWATAGRGPSYESARTGKSEQSEQARRFAKKNSWYVRGNNA